MAKKQPTWKELKEEGKDIWRDLKQAGKEFKTDVAPEVKRDFKKIGKEFNEERKQNIEKYKCESMTKERNPVMRVLMLVIGIVWIIVAIPMILSIVGAPIGAVVLAIGIYGVYYALPARNRAKLKGWKQAESETK